MANTSEFIIEDGSLISYRGRSRDIISPDGVTSIGDGAFEDCDYLTSVTIPDSVTSIGKDAFAACERLTNIIIPDSVTFIGNGAFWGCDLYSVALPKNLTCSKPGLHCNEASVFPVLYLPSMQSYRASILTSHKASVSP